MNNLSIGPWSRVLVRLDAVPTNTIIASLPKNRKRCLTTPDNMAAPPSPTASSSRPQKRIRSGGATASSARLLQLTQAQPSTTRDPFDLLPLHVLADIIEYLNPLDVIVHQRVSKAWRVILASEYIYTLALRFHFPFSTEARDVWRLHRGGERFPEAAVAGYRTAAKRYTRRQTQISRVECEQVGAWAAADGWLVFQSDAEDRIAVQKLGVGEARRRWIDVQGWVHSLAVGGGFLRILHGFPHGTFVQLYDLKNLSRVWEVSVPRYSRDTLTMSDTHVGYIVADGKSAGRYDSLNFHLISLATGQATQVLTGVQCDLPADFSSYLTPNSEILVVGAEDNIHLFSIPSGGTLLLTIPLPPPRTKLRPYLLEEMRFEFSEVTNMLCIISDVNDLNPRAWKIHIRSATDVRLCETIAYQPLAIDEDYGFDPFDAEVKDFYSRFDSIGPVQIFGPHDNSIILSPFKKGLEIDAVWYDGVEDYTRWRVHPSKDAGGEEEEGVVELEPRSRIPGMLLERARWDDRWLVIEGKTHLVVVDFGTD